MQVIIKDNVTAVLDAIGAKARHMKPVAEAMGLAVVGLTIRSFNDPSVRASPWAALHPFTFAQKLAEGTSTAILKRHVLLARSWRVTEVSNDGVKVGSDRFYAYFHQFGTKRVAARPMLPMTGGPTDPKFTPLALSRMVSVGKAALAGLLLPKRAPRKPKPPTAP
jgi:phage gpG-like protein